MRDLDPSQYGEADRRAVDPPIQVEIATWSKAGQLDWWVRERREWWVGYSCQTAVNVDQKLLIFDRRAGPSADCWCCESHAISCPRTTGRESNRYKAHATSGGCVPRSAGAHQHELTARLHESAG